MNVEIRRVAAGDEALFARIAEGVFDEPVDAARLKAYLAEPGHFMLVAIAEGETVGQAAAVIHRHPDKATELYIDEVGVADAWRRKGIARRLVEEMLQLGRSLGCEEAWLGTEHDNVPARRLYESFDADREDFVMYVFKL
ncbi:GNAT family N-acetyltransferase [Aquamicrobium sp. LC103]|uniref:GNAT family N-acetyltransferase n=1 Tax=Aquamicrobium sp. LC103 TaxID=1120658 RepID=UPI00063E841E|nr:GNAT family N-acetyltransferase [Aquamicrobium sp. LC103]TKT82824.1 GNAT family N-acetyltransferase [Aquamicrobium sp. LC103]